MVDHIQFPRSLAPLFPAEKIKKVQRRKDQQQDAAFKENLEKEKKKSDEPDEEDNYESGAGNRRAPSARPPKESDSGQEPTSGKDNGRRQELESEKRIDVHA